MKKLFTIVFILTCISVFAQETETELVRSAFRLEKKAVVAEFLALDNDNAAKFWPIYEKYEQERTAIGTRRVQLINKYVDKYTTMNDTDLDALVKESATIQTKEVALKEKYYGIVKKSINTSVAARFYQIEDIINVAVRMELYDELPLLQKK
jgi:hypothetical protein